METITHTSSELIRLHSARRFRSFNFDLNASLQGILKLAAELYDTPAAFITLIDEHTQLFKATLGFDVSEMPRETSFCTHAILQDDVMIVDDAPSDPRFSANPLVCNAPHIRFYAGSPLPAADGCNVGTLCVMDVHRKVVSGNKKHLLGILARQAIHLMELELTQRLLHEKIAQVEHQNEVLSDIAFIQSHEFRGPLATIMGLMNVIREDDYRSPKQYLMLMEEVIHRLDEKIHMVVRSTERAEMAFVI